MAPDSSEEEDKGSGVKVKSTHKTFVGILGPTTRQPYLLCRKEVGTLELLQRRGIHVLAGAGPGPRRRTETPPQLNHGKPGSERRSM